MHVAVLVAVLLMVGAQGATSQTVRCQLAAEQAGLGGTCVLDPADPGPRGGPRMQLARLWPAGDAVRIGMAAGPHDPPPWRGTLSLPHRDIPFEIARERLAVGERLVLRSGVAWVLVHAWEEAGEQLARGESLLVFGLTDYPMASGADVAILGTALARLDSIPAWDRQDDRDCTGDAGGVSLFCLLYSAVEAHMGRYHHRQPAMEIVRGVINQRWPDRWEGHQLMDFNNHPATTMDDLRVALQLSLAVARAEAQGAMATADAVRGQPPGGVDRVGWLAGCWEGTLSSGAAYEETWLAPRAGTIIGMARMTRDGRTLSFEFMRIAEDQDGVIVYSAQPAGRPPTHFRATEIGPTVATFENPAHDFPQRIRYRLTPPDDLLARIEGERDGQARGFDFPLRRSACPG